MKYFVFMVTVLATLCHSEVPQLRQHWHALKRRLGAQAKNTITVTASDTLCGGNQVGEIISV